MTDMFLIICALSVAFFVVFLVQCSLPIHKSAKYPQKVRVNPAFHKIAEPKAVNIACSPRFLARLEREMAEFLATHGRMAAALLVGMALVPFVALAQDQSGPSLGQGDAGSGQQSGAANQGIPPAVAKQLEAMQKRIDKFERELNARGPVASNSALPTHHVNEQTSPPNSGPQATES